MLILVTLSRKRCRVGALYVKSTIDKAGRV